MAKFKTTGVLGIMMLGLGAIAFVTNPGEAKYRKYAQAALKNQLKEQVCSQATEKLGAWLEGQCNILVDTASPHLAQVIGQQTQRQNFLLLSIYQADLPLPSPLPTYHVETLGIFGNFYTYEAKEL